MTNHYEIVGIGSPRPRWRHQRIIQQAIHTMYDELDKNYLFVLPEATVTNNWNDIAPDLVIFNEDEYPLCMIEITNRRFLKKHLLRCEALTLRFPDGEYFVLEYESGILYQYDTAKALWRSSEEYDLFSRYLQQPLLYYFSKPQKL